MQPLHQLCESPSQTAGPYVHIGCVPNFCGITGVYPTDLGSSMVTDETRGERISITGTIFDGTGNALKDAMVEIWQADAQGLYPGRGETRGAADPAFTGWGRQAGDYETGAWRFDTIKPGPVPFPGGQMQAPHITVWIVARGINLGLHTRLYFPDEDNSADPILTRIEHKSRIPTLVAGKTGPGQYQFDIRLQGEAETIFFDI